jgi:tRNA A37 threonylcarbamoyltransferase TsaD
VQVNASSGIHYRRKLTMRGEAFDKSANSPYPGGPLVDQLSQLGNSKHLYLQN